MKSRLGLSARQDAARIIAFERCFEDVRAIPAADRRLATYRRCLVHVMNNATRLQGKLKRARTVAKKERWQCAIELWLDLARYFEDAIRTRCGERF